MPLFPDMPARVYLSFGIFHNHSPIYAFFYNIIIEKPGFRFQSKTIENYAISTFYY